MASPYVNFVGGVKVQACTRPCFSACTGRPSHPGRNSHRVLCTLSMVSPPSTSLPACTTASTVRTPLMPVQASSDAASASAIPEQPNKSALDPALLVWCSLCLPAPSNPPPLGTQSTCLNLQFSVGLVLVLGVLNRVLNKMALAGDMQNFVFFLAQLQCFGYAAVYGAILVFRIRSAQNLQAAPLMIRDSFPGSYSQSANLAGLARSRRGCWTPLTTSSSS